MRLLAALVVAFLAACAGSPDPDLNAGDRAALAGSLWGLSTGWTARECDIARRDRDRDGVDDDCEMALAAAFAPLLVSDPGECNWDGGVNGGRLGGEYLFAVQRDVDRGRMRIAYLPAYYLDCGWSAPVCGVTPWLCDPHVGDSEAMVVQVAYDSTTRRWATDALFLSAHCHGRSNRNCRWYGAEDLARFQWVDARPRGAPVVWVASGKHGNYPSREACDRGHWFYDSCDANVARRRFPILSERQNIGSRRRPFMGRHPSGCVAVADLGGTSELPDPAARECPWRPDVRFRGWQRSGGGSTSYARYLREEARFR